MSDQAAVEPTEPETPAQSAAVETPTSAEAPPPWGEDFNPERAWQTITHQRDREKELAAQVKEYERLQTDPDARAAFLAEHGYELIEEEPEEPGDPNEVLAGRIEQVEQEIARRDQAAADRTRLAQVEEILDEKIAGFGVDEEDGNDILAYAIQALPPTAEGLPDVDAAFARFQAKEQARQKKWLESKRAPHIAPAGGDGTPRPPEGETRAQRVARMTAQVEAGQG